MHVSVLGHKVSGQQLKVYSTLEYFYCSGGSIERNCKIWLLKYLSYAGGF